MRVETEIESVQIQIDETEKPQQEMLRQLLKNFLSKVKSVNQKHFPQENWEKYSLFRLISIATDITSYD